jgi:hypothetical protein
MVGRLANRVEGAILIEHVTATVAVVDLEKENEKSGGSVRHSKSERSCSGNTVR